VQVGLPVPAAWGRVSVRGDVYAQSIQYFSSTNNTLPGTELPGYHLLNFKVMWQNIGRTSLSLSGYVKNALNTTYYVGGIPFGNIFSVNSADPGVPRTYGMELECKF
jgi:iron complex outermembrane receptor protein